MHLCVSERDRETDYITMTSKWTICQTLVNNNMIVTVFFADFFPNIIENVWKFQLVFHLSVVNKKKFTQFWQPSIKQCFIIFGPTTKLIHDGQICCTYYNFSHIMVKKHMLKNNEHHLFNNFQSFLFSSIMVLVCHYKLVVDYIGSECPPSQAPIAKKNPNIVKETGSKYNQVNL